MKHEDGYCDECGAQLVVGQLTITGLMLCEACVRERAPQTPITFREVQRDNQRR